jgi:uncharacterized protein (TIGR03546 family)
MIIPRPIGKILAILRGGVSPIFIFLSIALGFWFGLVPGFSGLHIALIVLVLVLNIHIGLFLLSAGIGKSLCFAAAPALYHIGTWVQGYLSFLPRLLASVPVIGITDFSRYSVAGALVVGPIIGCVAGLLMARSVVAFRRMLLKLEEGSEQFKKWYSNRWVRILDRILVGRRTKDAKSLFTAKTKIVRKVGVVLAALVLAIAALATALMKDTKIRDYAATKLTRANGAEVDIDSTHLSLFTADVSVSGLQVTDREKPQNNQVAIEKIGADVSVYNLLLGKLVMENVEVAGIKFNQKRTTPGKIVEKEVAKESPAFDPGNFQLEAADVTKLEAYLKDAKALRQWLQKARPWLPKSKKDAQAAVKEVPQKYLEYLEARAVVPASPRILAKKVLLDKVQSPSQLFGSSQILLRNMSDSARTAGLPVALELKSHETQASINVTFHYSAKKETPDVSGAFDGFDLSRIQSGLGQNAGLTFKSGVASGQFRGQITSESIDLVIDAAMRGVQANAQGDGILGLGSSRTGEVFDALQNLKTTIRVIGPVTEPRIAFDVNGLMDQFKQALVKAGKQRLIKEIDEQLGKQLGEKVPEEVRDVLGKPKDLIEGIGGLLGGKDTKKQEKE